MEITINHMKKGFTLIELLIVIAIIGVLSSVVLNALNNSRQKAADSKIKQQLIGFRRAAEIYYSNQSPGNYGSSYSAGSCPTSGVNGTMFFDSNAANGNPYTYLSTWTGMTAPALVCGSNGTAYAVKSPLSTGNGWCVDSVGTSKSITSGQIAGSANVCPP